MSKAKDDHPAALPEIGEIVRVTPAPDRRVRKEDGAPLDAAGDDVAWSTYWARRLADADILLAVGE